MSQLVKRKQNTDMLDTQQVTAIERLISGDTVTAAAAEAGVDRSTVYRWLKEDAEFVAELNRRRSDLLDAVQERLCGAALAAAETVESAVKAGDLQAALVVLRGLGFLGGHRRKVGYTDAEDVAADHRRSDHLKSLTIGMY